jgi:hypothetical protein
VEATRRLFHGTSLESAEQIKSTGRLTGGSVTPDALWALHWARLKHPSAPRVVVLRLTLRLRDLCEPNPGSGSGRNFSVVPGAEVLTAEILPDDHEELQGEPYPITEPDPRAVDALWQAMSADEETTQS